MKWIKIDDQLPPEGETVIFAGFLKYDHEEKGEYITDVGSFDYEGMDPHNGKLWDTLERLVRRAADVPHRLLDAAAKTPGGEYMKCDELRIENACVYGPDAKVYLAEQVDAAIAELKQKLEDVKASHYAEMVDAGMRERRLRRALWIARALRARDIQRWWIAVTCSKTTERACSVWNNVERKCRAKAEGYK